MAAFNQHIEDGNVMCKSTTDAGNGLFATRQIKLKNTILSVNQPLMLALDTPRLKDTCYCCLTYMDKSGQIRHGDESQTKALKACTGCHTVRYCDKVCEYPDFRQVGRWLLIRPTDKALSPGLVYLTHFQHILLSKSILSKETLSI
jgi:hypothetical protein